jgi:hypothetical protein
VSCAVNLLPQEWVESHARSRRRNAWIVACVLGAALLTCLLVAGQTANRSTQGLRVRLGDLRSTATDLDRRLASAVGQRNMLAQQARAICALNGGRRMAQDLAALAAAVPDGAALSELRVQRLGAPSKDARGQPAVGTEAKTAAGEAGWQIELSGSALSAEEVTALIGGLRGAAGWSQIDLVEAVRKPLFDGEGVAFRIRCVVGGTDP